jgi:hypothetical protein
MLITPDTISSEKRRLVSSLTCGESRNGPRKRARKRRTRNTERASSPSQNALIRRDMFAGY